MATCARHAPKSQLAFLDEIRGVAVGGLLRTSVHGSAVAEGVSEGAQTGTSRYADIDETNEVFRTGFVGNAVEGAEPVDARVSLFTCFIWTSIDAEAAEAVLGIGASCLAGRQVGATAPIESVADRRHTSALAIPAAGSPPATNALFAIAATGVQSVP